jgi:hypothetical protein
METTNATVKKEKGRTKLEVEDFIKFDPNIESAYVNTIELRETVACLFKPAFRDYADCKVCLNTGDVPQAVAADIPIGSLYVKLYFRPNESRSEKAIANIVGRNRSEGRSRFDSLCRMSGANSGRTYDVTTETYEALDDFRFFNRRKANWNNLTSEVVSQYGYSVSYNEEILVEITGISLEAVLNKVYGERTDEGWFQYQASPVQCVANVGGEYVIQITKLDMKKLDDLRKQLGGPVQHTGYVQIMR